jgi:SAM-dependent methyltransferase
MTENTQRFTGRVLEYAQYRERYEPEIVLPILRDLCGLDAGWIVADIGAGTGMVGDLFRANGNRIFAIEPNEEMRAACIRLHLADSQFSVLDGSAENTGLADASVDMIAIGRALHWFNIDAALPEFHRILKPGGWVAILACGRREDGRAENVAFKALLNDITGRDNRPEKLRKVYERMAGFFPGGEFHHAEADGEMCLNWDQLRGLTLSISHAPLPGAPNFDAFESALRSFFDQHAKQDRITFAARTWVSVGRFSRVAAP